MMSSSSRRTAPLPKSFMAPGYVAQPKRHAFNYRRHIILSATQNTTCILGGTYKPLLLSQVVDVLGFPLPFYSSPTLLLSLGLSVRVLYHLITRRPDIIHVSTPGILVFAATLYAKMLSVPLVVSYHTHVPEYIPKYTWPGFVRPMWALIRMWTRLADLTLVTSAVMKAELTANKCHDKQIEIWQRGVDTEVFHPRYRSTARRAAMLGGLPDDTTLLVYVGRLGAEKNLYQLRDWLDRLGAAHPQACPPVALSFVGDGPERAALEAYFKGYPVTFMGMLRGQALSEAYASGDVFAMPSETETLGFVVLEAMAAGLAVVAVRAGGLCDIITAPGRTGLFYEPGDVDTASAHVAALAHDAAARRRMGLAAREDVTAWGWAAATQRLRSRQYGRAERRYEGRRRVKNRWARALLRMVLALWRALIDVFDYARPWRGALATAGTQQR